MCTHASPRAHAEVRGQLLRVSSPSISRVPGTGLRWSGWVLAPWLAEPSLWPETFVFKGDLCVSPFPALSTRRVSQNERSSGWEFPVLVNLEMMTQPGKAARPIWSGVDSHWLVRIPSPPRRGFPALLAWLLGTE